MTIRFANPKDKKGVLNLIAELMNHAYKRQGKPQITIADLPQKTFDMLLKRNDFKIFLAEENDSVIGLATLYIIHVLRKTKPRGELEELVVTENMRGKGIGKRLLQAVIDYCRKNNIYSLKLSTLEEAIDNHAFYMKQGGETHEKRFRFDIE